MLQQVPASPAGLRGFVGLDSSATERAHLACLLFVARARSSTLAPPECFYGVSLLLCLSCRLLLVFPAEGRTGAGDPELAERNCVRVEFDPALCGLGPNAGPLGR